MRAVAVDIGGSHLSCAVVEDCRLLSRSLVRTPPCNFRDLLPLLEEQVRNVVTSSGVEMESCHGIVLGFPGIVDSRRSSVLSTNAKFDDAVGIDLRAWAQSAFGLPLKIDNDARLALMGEHACGAARNAEDAVLVMLGTGIGGAAMLAGRPLRGDSQYAGCLGGHLPVTLNGRLCTCGNVGCAEAEASTWALPQICREWPGFANSLLARTNGITFAKLFEAVDAGDALAKEILAHCCLVWATLAVALIHAYSPQVLVFGGGVMERSGDILPVIRAHVQKHAWMPRGPVDIRAASLGPDAPLLGAIPFLMENLSV